MEPKTESKMLQKLINRVGEIAVKKEINNFMGLIFEITIAKQLHRTAVTENDKYNFAQYCVILEEKIKRIENDK